MNALQQIKAGTLLSPTTSAVTTVRAATVDASGADYAIINVNLSAEKNTDATGVVLFIGYGPSNVTTTSSFTTLAANRTEDLTTAHSVTYCVPVKDRYILLHATPDTTTNGNVIIGATSYLGRLERGPSSTSEMLISTHDVVVVGS